MSGSSEGKMKAASELVSGQVDEVFRILRSGKGVSKCGNQSSEVRQG